MTIKIWPCKKRWPRMRPVIETMDVRYSFTLSGYMSVGIAHKDGEDIFNRRVKRAAARESKK